MSIGNWYRVGTVAVTNGSVNVVGTGTFWTSQCNPGDRFTVDGENWYEVNTILTDTSLTLLSVGGSGAFAGATASNLAYAIDRNFTNNLNANIAASVASLVAQYQANSNGPLSGLFQNGAAATPGIAFLNEASTGWFHPATGTAALAVQGAEFLRCVGTSGGAPALIGIGTTAPGNVLDIAFSYNLLYGIGVKNSSSGTAAQAALILNNGTSQLTLGQFGSNYAAAGFAQANGSYLNASGAGGLTLATSGAAALKIDSAQRVGIGVTPSPWNIGGGTLDIANWLGLFGSNTGSSVGMTCNAIGIPGYWVAKNTAPASVYQMVLGQHQWLSAVSATAGANLTMGLSMLLDANGNLVVGASSGSGHCLFKAVAQGTTVVSIASTTYSANSAIFYGVANQAWNTAASAVNIGMNSTTNRSINVPGTVNTSGNDYAEYRQLIPALYGAVAKGALLGYDATGLMTNVFANVVGRVLPKSTAPSYVGGDTWGGVAAIVAAYGVADPGVEPAGVPDLGAGATADQAEAYAAYQTALAAYQASVTAFQAALETERVKWDRIALCGVVPVNISGLTSANIGQYLVPCAASDGTITATAVAKANLTLGQYIDSFGTIEAIGADGRPLVNVKNA